MRVIKRWIQESYTKRGQSTSYLALGNYAQNFLYYAVLAIPWNVTINLWNMIYYQIMQLTFVL